MRWGPWLLLLALLAGCARGDPELRLRDTFDRMREAVEQRDAAAMQQFLADDFIGNEGLDRDGARRTAAVLMMRYRNVGTTFGPLDVQMRGSTATIRFTAMLSGGSAALLPESAQVYDVETGWRQHGDDWQLVSARWTPAL